MTFQAIHQFTGNDAELPEGAFTVSGSTLYGTTGGGTENHGAIVAVDANSGVYQILHSFTGGASDGLYPAAGLVLVGSTLYGATNSGGASNGGTIFSINTDGTDFQILHTFTGADGDVTEQLMLSGSTLYGTTNAGGSSSDGTVFSINTNGTGFAVLHSFTGGTADGETPESTPTLVGSTLFGTTVGGGAGSSGTIYSINSNGTGYQVLYSFRVRPGDGIDPLAELTSSGSTLFGTTASGGANGYGTLFSINTSGTGYQLLYSFAGGARRQNPPVRPRTGRVDFIRNDLEWRQQRRRRHDLFDHHYRHRLYRVALVRRRHERRGRSCGRFVARRLDSLRRGRHGAYGNGVAFSINTDGTGYQLLTSFGGNPGGMSPKVTCAWTGRLCSVRPIKGTTALSSRPISTARIFRCSTSSRAAGTAPRQGVE